MAYLKLGCLKEASGHNKSIGLRRALDYIFNPLKTNDNRYIGGHNLLLQREDCSTQAYKEMINTKRLYGKETGRQGYHYKLSFAAEDNVTPELALQITEEFCSRCLSDYECAYAAHTNTAHLHTHIVFNSVNLIDGYKYRYEKGDWALNIQPIVNDICEKYSLSSLSLNRDEEISLKGIKKEKCKPYNVWMQKGGRPSGKNGYTNDMIRIDIEECISKASDYEDFKNLMESKGHIYNDKGKYITVLAPGRSRACRIINLTPDRAYTKENIINMINGIYVDKAKLKEALFKEWNEYNRESGNVFIFKYEINYIRMLEERRLVEKFNISNSKDLQIYITYVNECDKQLNIMRKNINKILCDHEKDCEKLDNILALYRGYKLYKQTGNNRYKDDYDRCRELYSELRSSGYDMYKMYLYRKKANAFIQDINDYKKHIYVQKKIAYRVSDKYKVNDRTERTDKSL